MDLPRDGQEYAHITFNQLPDGATVEASLNRADWHATINGDDALSRRFLVRGPDSTATDGALVSDDATLWIRVNDVPEHVIREAGYIWLA